jgi:hypothetical protein
VAAVAGLEQRVFLQHLQTSLETVEQALLVQLVEQ